MSFDFFSKFRQIFLWKYKTMDNIVDDTIKKMYKNGIEAMKDHNFEDETSRIRKHLAKSITSPQELEKEVSRLYHQNDHYVCFSFPRYFYGILPGVSTGKLVVNKLVDLPSVFENPGVWEVDIDGDKQCHSAVMIVYEDARKGVCMLGTYGGETRFFESRMTRDVFLHLFQQIFSQSGHEVESEAFRKLFGLGDRMVKDEVIYAGFQLVCSKPAKDFFK